MLLASLSVPQGNNTPNSTYLQERKHIDMKQTWGIVLGQGGWQKLCFSGVICYGEEKHTNKIPRKSRDNPVNSVSVFILWCFSLPTILLSPCSLLVVVVVAVIDMGVQRGGVRKTPMKDMPPKRAYVPLLLGACSASPIVAAPAPCQRVIFALRAKFGDLQQGSAEIKCFSALF